MAYRSVTAPTTGTTSTTVTKPSGTVNNDILIAGVGAAGGSAITAPAGWTQIGSELVLGAQRVAHFWKRASAEGASYIFSSAGAAQTVGQIVCFSGRQIVGTPFDGTTQVISASSTAHAVTGFTTTANDDLLLMYATMVNATNYSQPTNFTERADVNNSACDTRDNVAAGATGNPSTTTTATTQLGILFIAIKPISAGFFGFM